MAQTLDDFAKTSIQSYVSKSVVTIKPKDSVFKAVEILSQNNVGCLLVPYDKNLFGILSERDVLNEYAMEMFDFHDKPVKEIMTISPITIDEKGTLGEAYRLMNQHKIRHLPVVKKEEVIGVLSSRDVMKAFVEALDSTS